MKKIPFHIISGFLGSGKTTFLKRIIETCPEACKPGIIQNEFAPSNVDGQELLNTGKNFRLLEINNGSVFCVCLLGDFTRSLEQFIDAHHPGMIILEASGLSDTTSVAEVIAAGKLADKIYLATNWCIVDALHFRRTATVKQRLIHQIRMADVLLVNKTDMISEPMAREVTDEIRMINPFAAIKQTTYCNADFIPGEPVLHKFYAGSNKALGRPEINSMVIKSGKRITRDSLDRFLTEWAPRAFRIKGYVHLNTGETCAVQSVFDNIEIKISQGGFHPTELIALSDQFSLKEWNQSFRKLT